MKKFFSCEEAAERYGVKSVTVRDWIRHKKLPAFKLGRSYRIYTEDLLRFEEAGRTMTPDEQIADRG